ncbi:hypothetical protein HMPREF9062_1056 [Actinomyces sp. oral taxon 448 str. F0400]|nr:hypothetical protein HMPREF9062_1056 [Actinomyces sp. oral taxon 448 str. F0400]
MCLHTLISAIVGMARAELKKLTLSPVSARMISLEMPRVLPRIHSHSMATTTLDTR